MAGVFFQSKGGVKTENKAFALQRLRVGDAVCACMINGLVMMPGIRRHDWRVGLWYLKVLGEGKSEG